MEREQRDDKIDRVDDIN